MVTGGLIDLNNIQFVKLVDIPGSGAFLDSQEHPIIDNWLTTGSGGYDFQLPAGKGVGVLNAIPEPTPVVAMLIALSVFAISVRQQRMHPMAEPGKQGQFRRTLTM